MGTLPRAGSVEIDVDAAPNQVWALLADVTSAGDWSHETKGGEWLDGATAAVPGARFRGRNQQGRTRWSRVCEVLVADAPTTISWRTVPTRTYRDSTIWTYELAPTATGTRVRQRFEVVKLNPVIDRILYAIIPAHRDRTAALTEDVRRLGAAAKDRVVEPTG